MPVERLPVAADKVDFLAEDPGIFDRLSEKHKLCILVVSGKGILILPGKASKKLARPKLMR